MLNTHGENLISLKDKNIALIIRLLQKNGELSRVILSKLTGLTQASITNIMLELIDKKIIVETGMTYGKKGRRSIGVTLNENKCCYIGIRINRDYISAVLFDFRGKKLKEINEKVFFNESPLDVLNRIYQILRLYIKDAPQKVIGIGMALPGPMIPNKGRVLLMSGFPGWESVNIREELSGIVNEFGVDLILDHDANCGAMAEIIYGKNAAGNALYILADMGIGCGIIVNGELYIGREGLSGELGHISIDYNGPVCECGNRGCLEMYCSRKVIEEDYKKLHVEDTNIDMGNEKASSFENIKKLAVQNYAPAVKVISDAASFLGIGLAGIINLFNPDEIILSDKIVEAGSVFINPLEKALKKRLIKEIHEGLKIRRGSDFDCDPILLGAGALIFNKILESPTKYLFNI